MKNRYLMFFVMYFYTRYGKDGNGNQLSSG